MNTIRANLSFIGNVMELGEEPNISYGELL